MVTSSATFRCGPAPASVIGPSSTLLSCRSIPQTSAEVTAPDLTFAHRLTQLFCGTPSLAKWSRQA